MVQDILPGQTTAPSGALQVSRIQTVFLDRPAHGRAQWVRFHGFARRGRGIRVRSLCRRRFNPCPARDPIFFDAGDYGAHGEFGVGCLELTQDPRGRGRQIDIGLVGLQQTDRFVALDDCTVVLEPSDQHHLADRLA